MGANDLLLLADHFGPWVIIAGVMLWDKREDRKAARQREVDEIDRQKADRDLARERIGTDKSLASSMTELAAEIRGMKR
jgi:hypothetical protein